MTDILSRRKANNRKATGYAKDGMPGEVEGSSSSLSGGPYYDAKSGPDRWDSKKPGRKDPYN